MKMQKCKTVTPAQIMEHIVHTKVLKIKIYSEGELCGVDRNNAICAVQRFLKNNKFRREKRRRSMKLSEEHIKCRKKYLRELREKHIKGELGTDTRSLSLWVIYSPSLPPKWRFRVRSKWWARFTSSCAAQRKANLLSCSSRKLNLLWSSYNCTQICEDFFPKTKVAHTGD